MSRSRNFDNNETSRVQVGFGEVGSWHTGAFTVAAIIRRSELEWHTILSIEPDSSQYYRLCEMGSSGQPGFGVSTRVEGGYQQGWLVDMQPPANEWVLLAANKAVGNSMVKVHMYRFSNDTWEHEDTVQTEDATGTASVMYLGHSRFWDQSLRGLMAIAGVWNRSLSDGEIETLAEGVQNWLDIDPSGQGRAVWVLDQESTSDPVLDLTEGGADQIGSAVDTSVSTDVPPGFTYLPSDDPSGGSDASLMVTAEGEGYAVINSGSESSVEVTTQGNGFPVFSGGSDASVSVEPTAGIPPRIDITVMIGPTRVGSSEVSDPRSGSIQIGPTRMERRN